MNEWQPIDTAPKDGTQILACFKGQFDWVIFIAHSDKSRVWAAGYASPTHWQPLPKPPSDA